LPSLLALIGWRGLAGLAVAAVLSILLVIQKGETRHWRKEAAQQQQLAENYKAQLDRISSEKQAQKIVTRTKIQTVTRTIREKAEVAEKVEQAPLPGQCRSPKEILDADI
jgi:hypothetical protein